MTLSFFTIPNKNLRQEKSSLPKRYLEHSHKKKWTLKETRVINAHLASKPLKPVHESMLMPNLVSPTLLISDLLFFHLWFSTHSNTSCRVFNVNWTSVFSSFFPFTNPPFLKLIVKETQNQREFFSFTPPLDVQQRPICP